MNTKTLTTGIYAAVLFFILFFDATTKRPASAEVAMMQIGVVGIVAAIAATIAAINAAVRKDKGDFHGWFNWSFLVLTILAALSVFLGQG